MPDAPRRGENSCILTLNGGEREFNMRCTAGLQIENHSCVETFSNSSDSALQFFSCLHLLHSYAVPVFMRRFYMSNSLNLYYIGSGHFLSTYNQQFKLSKYTVELSLYLETLPTYLKETFIIPDSSL